MSAASSKKILYDITLYGATGYTGRLIASYLAKHSPSKQTIALAGRSVSKLEALRTKVERPDFAVASADLGNQDDIDTLVAQSRVVIAAAGPFALCGEPLVSACARKGTDYVDITGEAPWVAQMIERYEETARKNGSILVPMAGFDSVPSDMGCFLAVNHAKNALHVAPHSVCSYFIVQGGASGGTLRSIFNLTRDNEMRKRIRDTLSLCRKGMIYDQSKGRLLEDSEIQSSVQKVSDAVKPGYSGDVQAYVAPFLMAGANTRVVRRSAALSATSNQRYSQPDAPFAYNEMMLTKSWLQSCIITFLTYFSMMLFMVPGFSRLGFWLAPPSGEGPSEEKRQKGKWSVTSVADTKAEKKAIVNVTCGIDAYDFTAASISECALLLATQREHLPGTRSFGGSGFLTPMTAFGELLEKALEERAVLKISRNTT